MSRRNRTGIDWSNADEVREYDRMRKKVEREEYKQVWEDSYGNRVPSWLFSPARDKNTEWQDAYKDGNLFKRKISK